MVSKKKFYLKVRNERKNLLNYDLFPIVRAWNLTWILQSKIECTHRPVYFKNLNLKVHKNRHCSKITIYVILLCLDTLKNGSYFYNVNAH